MVRAIQPARFPWFDYGRYSFSLGLYDGEEAVLSGHSASEYDADEGRIVVRGDMARQACTAYDKIEAILDEVGLTLADAVLIVENVTMRGIADYAAAADVRAQRLAGATPAVSTRCVDSLLRPDALIEVAVTARHGGARPLSGGTSASVDEARAAVVGADGMVYLSSVLPVDDAGNVVGATLVEQSEAAFDRAERLLEGAGLGWGNVGFILDMTTPATLRDYRSTGAVRRERLVAPYPASAGILMNRLAVADALIQLDIVATRQPREAVNPGWQRYDKLTYSPAVRAGNVLFMSGQAALDPETERAVFPGDIAAQAEYTYGNILAVLDAAGGGPQHLVETVEFVTRPGLARYRETAAVRTRILSQPYPASTGIVCDGLLRPEFELEVLPFAVLDAPSPP